MCCEYNIGEESLATNCDVEESPIGDTHSRGNRIRKPADQQTSVNVKPNRFSATTETHWEGGRILVQLNENSDQLNGDT